MPAIHHFAPPSHIKAPPLSFAARVGELLFVSGIPGFDDKGSLPDGFEAQFGFVVYNVRRVLGDAGASLRDLVKVNVLLTRASDVAASTLPGSFAATSPPSLANLPSSKNTII